MPKPYLEEFRDDVVSVIHGREPWPSTRGIAAVVLMGTIITG